MKQEWEYIIVKIEGGGQNGLNEGCNKMGKEGWEAWHIEDRPDHALVFLKRAKVGIMSPMLFSPELKSRRS